MSTCIQIFLLFHLLYKDSMILLKLNQIRQLDRFPFSGTDNTTLFVYTKSNSFSSPSFNVDRWIVELYSFAQCFAWLVQLFVSLAHDLLVFDTCFIFALFTYFRNTGICSNVYMFNDNFLFADLVYLYQVDVVESSYCLQCRCPHKPSECVDCRRMLFLVRD